MAARSDNGASSEGEGDEIRPYGLAGNDDDMNDSSEEEEEDEEEARRIKEGFIVDDDEEDDEAEAEGEGAGDDGRRRRERKERKRRKKRKRGMWDPVITGRRAAADLESHVSETGSADVLEEDDLELIAENTGQVRPSSQQASRSLKRFRRRHSASPPGGDDTGAGQESPDEGDPDLPDIANMFDAPAVPSRRRDYDDDDDSDMGMDDFIVDEDEGEGGDPAEARRRRKEEKQKRNKSKDDRWAGVSRE
jgi:transcription elongation factor SPT6